MSIKQRVPLFSRLGLFRLVTIIGAVICLLSPYIATAQSGSPVTTPTMIEGRNQIFYPGLNFLTFQHMDELFAKRAVKASDKPLKS